MSYFPNEMPVPHPTIDDREFWEYCQKGELRFQSCGACGTLRHYPRLLCDRCYSAEVVWKQASGRGSVHSWIVAHHVFHQGFASDVPYTLVTVDLEEGVRAMGRWLGSRPLALGLPVQASFRPRDETADLTFE